MKGRPLVGSGSLNISGSDLFINNIKLNTKHNFYNVKESVGTHSTLPGIN